MNSRGEGDRAQELIPIGEAARLLGLSVQTIRKYADEGKLHTYRTPGNQRRYRRDDVEALLTPTGGPCGAGSGGAA